MFDSYWSHIKSSIESLKPHYPRKFKLSAVNLAREIGVKKAVKKLKLKNVKVLSDWILHFNKIETDNIFNELEIARQKIEVLQRKLKKERRKFAEVAAAKSCIDESQ